MVRGRFAGAVVSPVIVAALWLGFAAQADADIHVQMISGQGLTVASDDVSQVETIQISATAAFEVAGIRRWGAGCEAFGGTVCIHAEGLHCASTSDPEVVLCDRTFPGISVALKASDDRLDLVGVGSERVSLDMGSGNDQVNQGLTFVPATGPWTAFLGSGNDRYVGSDGVDFVKGGSGIDSIDPGPGEDGVDAGSGDDRVLAGAESERAETDTYIGGTGFDQLDYSQRTTPIFAAKFSTTGGASGESDGISEFERITGGSGPTASSGSPAPATPATTR